MSRYAKFCLLALTLLLSSCVFTPELTDKLQTYIQSLNRYKGLSLPLVRQPLPAITLPAASDRLQPLSQFNVSLLEFLALQDCQIGYHLGKRNSLLGKVMGHSQRLIYETDIIRAIENCDFSDSKISESLQNKLQAVSQQKRLELYRSFVNAIWGGEEVTRFFSLSNGHLPMTIKRSDIQNLQKALESLTLLATELPQLPQLNQGVVENHLQTLYHSEYGGQLILTLLLLTDALEHVAGGLNELKFDGDFCLGPVKYLKQQMKQHYIDVLQPYMARVNTTAYLVLQHLNQLNSASQRTTKAMQLFLNQLSLQQADNLWGRYQQASQQHARAWDRILRHCQLFD